MTPVKAYMARRNETEKDFPYTYFHLVLTALVKTITLRPKMNRSIRCRLTKSGRWQTVADMFW